MPLLLLLPGFRPMMVLATLSVLLHWPMASGNELLFSPSHGSSDVNGSGGSNVQGPRLTTELPSRLLFSNSSGGSLPCSATGTPAPTIRWLTEDGDEAADVARLRHVRGSDGSLVFLPFRAEQFRRDVHEARYRCSAANAIGTVVSAQVHVTAVLDSNYEMRLSDRHVIAGNSVLLQCPIPEHLRDHVFVTSWQRVDGYVITRNSNGEDYVVTTGGQLYIREVRDSEELLRYRCHTENTLTRRKKTSVNFVRLLIKGAVAVQMPSILHRSSRIHSDPGETADLVCVAEGFPVPRYSWFKRDGQRMLALEENPRVRQPGGVLRIGNVVASDAGTYVCVVSNSVGEAQAEVELIVTPPPWVTVSPAHVRAEVGHAAAFRCNASGLDWALDETSLEWRHNGRRLSSVGIQSALGGGRSRVLHLPSIRRQDQGMYQCFVRLSPTRTVHAAAELIVGDQAPKLKSAFEEVTVRPGKPVSLRCVATGDPPPRIAWSLDGAWPMDSRHGRVHVRTVGSDSGSRGSGAAEVSSTLTISSVEAQDSGSYSCRASNYAGAADRTARVNVYGSVFIRAMTNLSALAGSTFTVQCPFGGYPFGHVYWEKDGRRLPLNQRQSTYSNGTLQIQATDREHDEGRYTCTVHGPDSQVVRRTTTLHVRSGPQITPFGFQANLHEGVRAGLTCLVHAGDPPIRIEWLRDGKPLVPGAHPDISILAPEGSFVSTLTLQRLSSRQNGNYSCRATNEYASVEHFAELLVKVAPSWTLEPNDTTAVSGRSVSVDCQASGVPQPHIRWKSSSEPDSPMSQFRTIISNSHIHILVNGTLSIRTVDPADAGLYLCEASNGVGSGISRVLQLTVRSPPRFTGKFTTVAVRRGESAEIACPAQGDQPIRFHWLKNNLPLNVLKEHRYSRVEDRNGEETVSKITIQQAERSDNAVFTCQAANEFGEDSTSVQLTVQDVPDPPSNVEVREVGSRTARVTWTPPFTGNSAITQYVLHWKTADGLWQDTLSVSGLETKATVRGLLPTTTYQLRVRADNVLGISDYSSPPVEFTTSKEPPRFPPKNVQAAATNTRTISVSFDNPRHSRTDDQIEGFYVGYRELSSLDAFTFKTFESSSPSTPAAVGHAGVGVLGSTGTAMEHPPHRLNFEVAGLRRSTEYAVTVQAFNGKGAGPQSEVVRVRTLDFDPPNAPLLRVGGTTFRSISVNWENENLQEAPITGYSLYYKVEGGADNEWHEVSVPHDRRAFTLSDLRCGTEYLVYIRATNRAGKGPQGETLSVRTNGGRPVEPDPRRLFETNTTFVVLHLEAWDSGGCPVSYFVVQYRPEARGSTPYSSSTSSEWTLHSNNVVPQQQLVQLADLVPGSWYTLLMSAHNDAGSTEVELSFATLTLAGDLPSRHYELLDPQVAFYRHLTVTVPIVSAILVLIIVVGVVCVILRKRSYESRQRIDDGMVVAECYDANKGDMVLAVSHESQARESTYYPAPYATHNRTDTMVGAGTGLCNSAAGARAGSFGEDPKNRTYDVPYPVKRLETWEPNRETLAACMEVYEKTGLEGIYGASPLHVSKPKTPRTRRTPSWKEDGDRSSGSENDADDLLDEDCDGVVPETLIVPLDTLSSWDIDASCEGTTSTWKEYPSAYQAANLRFAGEYTSIT